MSATRLKVTLSPSADQTLLEFRNAVGVPKQTKERAEVIRLSHRGWTTEQIADYQGRQVATVRKAIHRWQASGLYGLWDLLRSGRRVKRSAADIEYLVDKLDS